MTFFNYKSIISFSEKEIRIRMLYTYYIISSMREYQIDSDIIKLVLSFVNCLKKREHFTNVVSDHIERFISEGKLHLVPLEQENEICKIPSKRSLKYHFYEDESVWENFNTVTIENDSYANFIRCIYIGKKEILLRIYEQVFFSNTARGSLKKYSIPKELKQESEELIHTQFLVDAKALNKGQALVTQAVYRITITKEFYDLCYDFFSEMSEALCKIGLEEKNVRNLCYNLRVGILNNLFEWDLSITKIAFQCIDSKSLQPIFNDLSRILPTSNSFPINSFPIKKEFVSIAKSLLSSNSNVNILLYGAAGSGKTEFARTLAKSCKLKAIRFKNSYVTENSIDEAISGLNVMLSIEQKDCVFIIDEAESILETKALSLQGDSGYRKGVINKLFESCKNKVIWIVNYTDRIDETTKRRFTFSIQFDKMNEDYLTKISKRNLKKLDCSKELKNKIIDLCGKYEVTGSSVNNMLNVVKAFNGFDEQSIENNVRCVLESNAILLNGQAKMRQKAKEQYDISILNSTIPAQEILEMVKNAKLYAEQNPSADNGIRMLFYGLSGTGKTEFARFIAQTLGKKILIKRASDILSKWVGDSEKNISEAFSEAQRTNQILLFDEADTFFRNREFAQHSWEISETNEFLTQMEEFKGILICTTNLRKILDKAMLRRFHICTEFKALSKEGIKKLFSRYFPSLNFSESQLEPLLRFNTVTAGDFGTISSRIRFMPPSAVNPEYLVKELANLQKEKDENLGNYIGFSS